jgi:hypothetical protein
MPSSYESKASSLCEKLMYAIVATLNELDHPYTSESVCQSWAERVMRRWMHLDTEERLRFAAENKYWNYNCERLSLIMKEGGRYVYDVNLWLDEMLEKEKCTEEKVPIYQDRPKHWNSACIKSITKPIEDKSSYSFKRHELLMAYLIAKYCVRDNDRGGPCEWATHMLGIWSRFLPWEREQYKQDVDWLGRCQVLVTKWKSKWTTGWNFSMETWLCRILATDDALVGKARSLSLPPLSRRQNLNLIEHKTETFLDSYAFARSIFIDKTKPQRHHTPQYVAEYMENYWTMFTIEQQKEFFANQPGWKENCRQLAESWRVDGEMQAWAWEWLRDMITVKESPEISGDEDEIEEPVDESEMESDPMELMDEGFDERTPERMSLRQHEPKVRKSEKKAGDKLEADKLSQDLVEPLAKVKFVKESGVEIKESAPE